MMAAGLTFVVLAMLAEFIFKSTVSYDTVEVWIAGVGLIGIALCVASLIVLAGRYLP